MSQRTLTLPAFAKINWRLRVLGKREDGYHEIDTVLQTVSVHDLLTVTVTDDPTITLSCDDRTVPSDKHNLIWRAASALKARYSVNRGASMRLEKRIPVQAGLGGGSSDAAVTLIALAHLWEIEAPEVDLIDLAADLGNDVPFFLYGGTARGTDTGKTISPLADAPETYSVALKPNANIATTKAYHMLNAHTLTSSDSKFILSSSLVDDFADILGPKRLRNDFEAVAFQLKPEIERAKAGLLKAGARAAMLAGSGSAVFGIFDNQDAQERAIQAIELEAGWRVFPCKTVGRDHYRSAMGPAGEILARLFG